LLINKPGSFDIYEVKATQTITSGLFKEMDRFEEIAAPNKVNKTLIYGGNENQQRTRYKVISRRDI
jgi:hypothetical protein